MGKSTACVYRELLFLLPSFSSLLSLVSSNSAIYKADYSRILYVPSQIVREKGKGGIDWWRYQQVILKPKLIPFALECIKDRPGTIVQEDKAPAHASRCQDAVFSISKVARLFWCGNSPDLNMIESCWPYMKRKTTAKDRQQTGRMQRRPG
jgi:hypothetical protein